MKTLFTIMVVAMGLMTSPMAYAEQTEHGMLAVKAFSDLEKRMKDLTATLASITDKASADANAQELMEKGQALQQQLADMQELSNTLTQTPNADDEVAFEKCRNSLHETGIAMQQEFMRLAMVNFYDSEALLQALQSLNVAEKARPDNE